MLIFQPLQHDASRHESDNEARHGAAAVVTAGVLVAVRLRLGGLRFRTRSGEVRESKGSAGATQRGRAGSPVLLENTTLVSTSGVPAAAVLSGGCLGIR